MISTIRIFFSAVALGSVVASFPSLNALMELERGAPFAGRAPQFRVELETIAMMGSNGSYGLPVSVIRDDNAGGGVVATYVRKDSFINETGGSAMGEINLVTFNPDLTRGELQPFARYGWAYLFGQRLTTIPWYDCCSETGDVQRYSLEASADGTEVLLVETQLWFPNSSTHPGRDAQSQHNFTVRLDPRLGYVIDASLLLRTNVSAKSVEFTNWLPPILANPWPAGQWGPGADVDGRPYFNARGSATVWPVPGSRPADRNFTGFTENLLAGAMLGSYHVGGFVATVGAEGQYSPILAHDEAGSNLTWGQQTCPTWMDQHQIVYYPPPDVDGYYVMRPHLRMAFLPPGASAALLRDAQLVSWNASTQRTGGAAVMIRVGVLETFEDQPLPLTTPLRGLVQAWFNPDYKINHTLGFNSSTSSLIVPAMAPASYTANFYAFSNQQPLVPLLANTSYTLSAWVLPVASPAGAPLTAFLRCDSFEADDFNVQLREIQRNSTATSAPAAGWVLLSVEFTSPPWVSYADVRFVALGNGTAYVDDVWFGQTALAPPRAALPPA